MDLRFMALLLKFAIPLAVERVDGDGLKIAYEYTCFGKASPTWSHVLMSMQVDKSQRLVLPAR